MKLLGIFKTIAYILFALVCFDAPITTFARTVPVAEIVRPTNTSTVPSVMVDETFFAEIPKKTGLKTWNIAEQPMFMEHGPFFGNSKSQYKFATKLDPSSVYALLQKISPENKITAEDPKFVLENGRVTEFSPGKNGFFIDYKQSSLKLLKNPPIQTTNFPLEGLSTSPTRTLGSTNEYGINEFLAGGVSDYSGSSKNRLANIDAGINQFKGVLIKPGSVFSFGEYLGDVTAAKGFKPEIVIKADGLKPELGGGICQVSSTLFRAVMQSGMPITQRKNHAFSVSHYLPAGTDATIYTPVTDLKFLNDTPAYVLVWPYYSSKDHLAFDLYGTKDGREVQVDEPIQWDRKSDGSLKASWTRHVTLNNQTRDDVIKSTYLPPALFKKEEKFVVAEPTPTPSTSSGSTTPSPTPSTQSQQLNN